MREEYFDENEDQYPEDMGRVFDMQDLFQDDNTIALEYTTHINVNRLIMETALRLLEKSFWWRFRLHAARMRLLKDTYTQMQQLLLGEVVPDHEDLGGDLDKEAEGIEEKGSEE